MVAVNPRVLEMAERVRAEIFQQKALHFPLFRLLPEASLKSSKTSLNLKADLTEAAPNRRVSSAKRVWFTFFTPLAILSPRISCSSNF